MNQMNKICLVQGCQFSKCHVSQAHQCGKCSKLGHGIRECENKDLLFSLLHNDGYCLRLNNNQRCTIKNCLEPLMHTLDGHKCNACDNYGHSEEDCETNNREINNCQLCAKYGNESNDKHSISNCPQRTPFKYNKFVTKIPLKEYDDDDVMNEEKAAEIINRLNKIQKHKIYIMSDAGMGCTFYIRRNKRSDKQFECFFMHSDSWGQYGEETDDRKYLAEFLYGFELVNC